MQELSFLQTLQQRTGDKTASTVASITIDKQVEKSAQVGIPLKDFVECKSETYLKNYVQIIVIFS